MDVEAQAKQAKLNEEAKKADELANNNAAKQDSAVAQRKLEKEILSEEQKRDQVEADINKEQEERLKA